MSRMSKTEKDWNGLKLGFLKTVQPNSFSKFISAVCNFKNNAQETYLSVPNLWLCNLHVTCNSDWGRVIGKIKQNELDCRDTAPLSRGGGRHLRRQSVRWKEKVRRKFSSMGERAPAQASNISSRLFSPSNWLPRGPRQVSRVSNFREPRFKEIIPQHVARKN